jgi:peptidyl-prolyl cis-trans isomerase C
VAATVNGEPINVAEVDAVLKLVPQAPATATETQKHQIRREALEMLIDDVLIRQFLSANTAKPTQAEFNKELEVLQAGLKARNVTMQDFLRDTNQTEDHLRLDIVKKIQWDHYVLQRATEAALKKYYDDNRDYFDHVTVQASHIMTRLAPTASDADKAQARARLVDLRQKIVAGQLDFAEAAKKYSQCQTASNGGDLGFFPRKWVGDENIVRAAFATPVGQVSDVVQSDFGLHLVKVTARKPGTPSNYLTMKEEVRQNFAMDLWHDVLVQQRKAAKLDIKLP